MMTKKAERQARSTRKMMRNAYGICCLCSCAGILYGLYQMAKADPGNALFTLACALMLALMRADVAIRWGGEKHGVKR